MADRWIGGEQRPDKLLRSVAGRPRRAIASIRPVFDPEADVWVQGVLVFAAGCTVDPASPPPPASDPTSPPPVEVPGVCGDGMLDDGEACDAGPANDDGGDCTTTCEVAFCGDGRIRVGVEDCDEGAANADDAACTASCRVATCGDGLLWSGVEDCDDGNDTAHDGCSPTCALPVQRDLSSADGVISGSDPAGASGSSVAGAGDLDGDGLDDLLIGAVLGGPDATGAAYVVAGPGLGAISLDSATATLIGVMPYDQAGSSVSGAGDIDGDGLADVIVGAPGVDAAVANVGAAYIVFGPLAGPQSLAAADVELIGQADFDAAGSSVAGAGDVDGDGWSDVLVGAPGHEVFDKDTPGAAYLVAGPVAGSVDLALATARLIGEVPEDDAGASVSSAGDVDGDGLSDVIIGAPGHDARGTDSGAAYVLLGPIGGTLDLGDADHKLIGEMPVDVAGTSVAGVGDVDGDGLDDVLVGAPGHHGGAENRGAAYLVNGGGAATLSLEDADATMVGIGPDAMAGLGVAGVGDVNGDGSVDLLIGANHGLSQGAAFVTYGPVSGTIGLQGADIMLTGEVGDRAGDRLAGAGDVDGDGLSDLVVGVGGRSILPGPGVTYLFLGSP